MPSVTCRDMYASSLASATAGINGLTTLVVFLKTRCRLLRTVQSTLYSFSLAILHGPNVSASREATCRFGLHLCRVMPQHLWHIVLQYTHWPRMWACKARNDTANCCTLPEMSAPERSNQGSPPATAGRTHLLAMSGWTHAPLLYQGNQNPPLGASRTFNAGNPADQPTVRAVQPARGDSSHRSREDFVASNGARHPVMLVHCR